MKLSIVIPTRNRASLAARAIRSIVDQTSHEARIVISDNSSDNNEADQLRRYVASLGVGDLHYIRPPFELPMSQHWDCAFQTSEVLDGATHATVLTDRMVFKPGALDLLSLLVSHHPHAVISYNHDVVDDYSLPVRLNCQPWTGETVSASARDLIYLASILANHPAAPRMLNCVTPVAHLEKLRSTYMTVFDSVAPDFCFAFRTLAVVESIIYLDKALLVHGSLARSNGASYARGDASRDHSDFIEKLGELHINHAAPVPEFETVSNTIASEYELQRLISPAKFPKLDMDAYFERMSQEIEELQNARLRHQMRLLLIREAGIASGATLGRRKSALRSYRNRPRAAVVALMYALVASSPTLPIWRTLGSAPPRTRWFKFADAEDAFQFAYHPGRRAGDRRNIAMLDTARESSQSRSH